MRKATSAFLLFTFFAIVVMLVVHQQQHNTSVMASSTPAANQKALYRPTGAEGTITGTIAFAGDGPRRKIIDMSADPFCVETNSRPLTEDVAISYGKLANVFVYIKSGSIFEMYDFEVPSSTVVLEHKACRYAPHLLGMQAGQVLNVLNSDPTAHNTHPMTKLNPEWNMSQAPGGEAIVKRFDRPETFIPFRCNQHPWEKAYLGVFSHPFFAITDRNGAYKIEGLPPGNYTLTAWHERFGEKTATLTVSSRETTVEDFDFASEPTAGL
jgi:carboxypeptidase family protein